MADFRLNKMLRAAGRGLAGWLFGRESYEPYRLTPREIVLHAAAGGFAGGLIGLLYFWDPVGLFCVLPAAAVWLHLSARRKALKKRRELVRMLRDYILSVIGFLRAGHALENAMRQAEREMVTLHGENSMIGSESRLISRRLSLQLSAEQLWQEFAARTDLKEGRELARIFGVAKRQGGDYLGVLGTLVRAMDDRETVTDEIETLLTGQRLEFHIMSAVPIGIKIYLEAAAPDLTAGLHTLSGRFFMAAVLILHVTAVLWGNRILEKSRERY